MGQTEVYDYLVKERKKREDWLTIGEVRGALRKEGMSNGALKGVGSDLYRLATFGQIQAKGMGLWKHIKLFRAYKK